jgi:sugar transferase (PEP-CTERM/EpsH1 system associated)
MARRIKILHVLHSFAPGGLENGVVNIINRSPDHLEHELCFLDRGGEFLERLARPVVYHELQKPPGNDFHVILRLRELFRKRGVDIVHTRNWGGFDGVLASCLTLRPAVIHSEHGRDIADPAGMNFRRNLTRRALAFRARKFVTVSKDLDCWLRRTVGVPESKLILIPNGVDIECFRPGKEHALRTDLGIAQDEFVVGTVGRLDPIKNHEGLVHAVRMLHEQGYKVRLVIIGDGPNRSRIETILKSSNIEDRVLLLGARTDVASLYRTFDTFVLNSVAEGMSNTLLEAMASGLPIVCTAVGGSVELVCDGDSGVLVEPGDDGALAKAIQKYMDSSETRTDYGRRARKIAIENFSLDRMVSRYVDLYESVA